MNSKINYVACGTAAMATLFSALAHLGALVIVNGFFTVWNWWIAEHRRELEEKELIATYEEYFKKNQEDKPNE